MIELYNEDCITMMRAIKESSVDLIIADPPYSSGGMLRGDRSNNPKEKYTRNDTKNYEKLNDFDGDTRDQRSYLYWSHLWMSQALDITKNGGLMLVFTDWRQLPITTDAVQGAGWVWRGIIPWHKQASRPMADRFTSSCEYIVWATKGARKVDMKDKESKYPEGFYTYRPPKDRVHVTEKPVELYRHIYQILRPNSKILDPFLGSGNSAIACHIEQMGHRFIGCEVNYYAFEVAKNRIKQAESQLSIPMH